MNRTNNFKKCDIENEIYNYPKAQNAGLLQWRTCRASDCRLNTMIALRTH